MRKWAILLATSALLSSCGGLSRPHVLSETGVAPALNRQRTGPANLVDDFLVAAEAARSASGREGSVAAQRNYMEAGAVLISVKCGNYLDSKADNQRRVNVWRDTFAPITALLTGAYALADKGETVDHDVLTAFSLGTTAANAGFKIYEERYLFSARNINSVRRLVLEAVLDNYREAARISDDKLNFRQATAILIEVQHVCSPQNISELVSQAIDAGKIVSTRNGKDPSAMPGSTPTPTPAGTPAPTPSATPTPPAGIERVTTRAI